MSEPAYAEYYGIRWISTSGESGAGVLGAPKPINLPEHKTRLEQELCKSLGKPFGTIVICWYGPYSSHDIAEASDA